MNRLKKLRVSAGLPLRVLEKYLNIPNATLSLIENGKQPMREIHVKKRTPPRQRHNGVPGCVRL